MSRPAGQDNREHREARKRLRSNEILNTGVKYNICLKCLHNFGAQLHNIYLVNFQKTSCKQHFGDIVV